MTRRDWQLKLKWELRPEQYRLVGVEEWPPGSFKVNVLHPDTRMVIATVDLGTGDPMPALQKLLETARDPVDRDRTIIPHQPPKT